MPHAWAAALTGALSKNGAILTDVVGVFRVLPATLDEYQHLTIEGIKVQRGGRDTPREELLRLLAASPPGRVLDAGRQAARAGLLGLLGDRDAAAGEYALVVPELADLGMVLEQALVVLDMALVLGPDSPLVQARVPEARAILERLGAEPYLERLESLLGASSTPPAASRRGASLQGASRSR